MLVSLIAAVDEHFGLGKDNALLCHLPADLQHFKSLTMGKPIIMGRNTFESIGKPLPGRKNIILSRQPITLDGVIIVNSLSAALELTKDQDEVMVIGGVSVYEQAIEYAQRIYLTLIHHQFEADVFFPPLDKTVWVCQHEVYRARDERNRYDMTFYDYQRMNPCGGETLSHL